MMDAVARFNLFEAIVWFLMSLFFLLSAYRKKIVAGQKKIFVFLSVIFVIFGISDLIEMRTGHWSKPLWLLLLKIGCVIGIFIGIAIIYMRKKK
jgi:succinate-acetate transporter protein